MYHLIREKSQIYKKLSNFVHEKRSPFLGLKTQKWNFTQLQCPFSPRRQIFYGMNFTGLQISNEKISKTPLTFIFWLSLV